MMPSTVHDDPEAIRLKISLREDYDSEISDRREIDTSQMFQYGTRLKITYMRE
jgi:hypothetical protein